MCPSFDTDGMIIYIYNCIYIYIYILYIIIYLLCVYIYTIILHTYIHICIHSIYHYIYTLIIDTVTSQHQMQAINVWPAKIAWDRLGYMSESNSE